MTPEVLHVVSTPSFMDFVSHAFEEAAPRRNTFVSVAVPLEKLRLPASARAEIVQRDQPGRDRLNGLIAKSQVTVFHNVTERTIAGAMAQAPTSTLKVWSGWGGDYYGSDLDGLAGIIGPETRRVVRRIRPLDFWPERLIELRHLRPLLHAAARSADVFSAPIPQDFDVFKRRFRAFRGRYSQLNYGSVEDTFAVGPSKVSGNDILLGNSATPENNHLEVLKLLTKLDLGQSRVYTPLNYGDPAYSAAVAKRGTELLGDRFVALTDPMSLSSYHELLSHCAVFVMGHRRQQALGNIFRAIWQGSHLVLDRRNPVVEYLSERGIRVMLFEDMARTGQPRTGLDPVQRDRNRAVLMEHWGRTAVLDNIRKLIDLV